MPTHRRAALVALVSTVLALGPPGLAAHALGAPGPAASADVYVAPGGDDHADGSARHPVRTLDRARDLVRARVAGLRADLTVHLAPGTYRRSGPLVLDARDSGANGHRVIWQGAGDSVITGGAPAGGRARGPGPHRPGAAPAPPGLTHQRGL